MTKTKADPKTAHAGKRMNELMDHIRAGCAVCIQKGLGFASETITGDAEGTPRWYVSARHSPTTIIAGRPKQFSRAALVNLLERGAVRLVDLGSRQGSKVVEHANSGTEIRHADKTDGWWQVVLA